MSKHQMPKEKVVITDCLQNNGRLLFFTSETSGPCFRAVFPNAVTTVETAKHARKGMLLFMKDKKTLEISSRRLLQILFFIDFFIAKSNCMHDSLACDEDIQK